MPSFFASLSKEVTVLAVKEKALLQLKKRYELQTGKTSSNK